MNGFSSDASTTLRPVRIMGMHGYGAAVEEEMEERRLNLMHLAALRREANVRANAVEVESRALAAVEYVQSTSPDRSEMLGVNDTAEEEDTWEEHGDGQENDGIPPPRGDPATMSTEDRVLYYAMHIQHFGLSNEEVKRMEDLMEVLYGTPTPISYDRDVKPFYDAMLHDFKMHRYFFCCECSNRMNEGQRACNNHECKIYGLAIKRAKKMERVEVHVVNVIPQLEEVLVSGIEKIISMHQELHEQGVAEYEELGDIRRYDGYREQIETSDAFLEKNLNVLLSVSVDGFRPRRISKREVWPLYLRVDGLPQNEANQYYNSIIAGAIHCRLKPTPKMMETLFSRLESELYDVRERPIQLWVDGHCWTINVRLHRGVADMAAQQVLFGLPRWNSEYGCSKCYIRGVRIGNQRAWIAESSDDLVLRDRQSYFADGELQQYGVNGVTPLMRTMLPCDFPADALHVCSEGVTRNRLRDLFSPNSKYPEMRMNREAFEKMKRCLLRTSWHTYSNRLVLSLDDLPTCKAAEIDELAFVAFPVSAAVGAIPCPVAAASILGYWLCLKIISRPMSLTKSLIEKAKLLAKLTRELWIIGAPETYTMKCHWFFDHAMEEEIAAHGSTYHWTSCPFESHHRRLQIRMNQSTTNSASALLQRYLITKKVRTLFNGHSDAPAPLRALKEKVDNKHYGRFPVDIRVTEDIYIPQNSNVSAADLAQSERIRISRTGEEPYSRLVVRGKVYSARHLWKRAKGSRQDIIHYGGENECKSFGSIVVFLYDRRSNSVKFLVNEYKTCDPFSHLHDLVNHFPNFSRRIALHLMREVRESNSHFYQLGGAVRRIRCASLILGPALLIKYENQSFVSRA